VIELTPQEWTRLYKEVALHAQRMTHTKNPKRQWTARDRAQEAVQRACERMLTQRPASVTSFETARSYLLGAIRSSLHHAGEEAEARSSAEQAAIVEDETVRGDPTKTPEQMQLEAGIRAGEQRRAARLVELTREELAGDRIALGTMDCIADDRTPRPSRPASSSARWKRCTPLACVASGPWTERLRATSASANLRARRSDGAARSGSNLECPGAAVPRGRGRGGPRSRRRRSRCRRSQARGMTRCRPSMRTSLPHFHGPRAAAVRSPSPCGSPRAPQPSRLAAR